MSLLPPITSNDYTGTKCTLRYLSTGEPVHKGDQAADARGDVSMIMSGVAPHKGGAPGYVHTECNGRYYAGVFGMEWVPYKVQE